jgi:hypothetical protein
MSFKKLHINKVKNKTNHFLVLLLVLFAGVANPIFLEITNSLIPILLSLLIYISRGEKLTRKAVKIYIFFIFFILAYFFKYNGDFDPMFTFRLFVYITFPYLVISVVKQEFFKIYEHIIYVFACISLPLFLVQAVAYYQLLSVLEKLQGFLMIPPMENWREYANVIFFTVNRGTNVAGGALRNCGFAWEPGGFANFLILAIIINLARNNFSFKNNFKLKILLITLITTFSTTGFLALGFVVLWFFFNSNVKNRIVLTPFFIIVLGSAIFLPFMSEKISTLSTDPQSILNEVSGRSFDTGNSYSIGRFAGLLMNFEDFKSHPIIGYGGHGEETWAAKNEVNVASINGLGRWLSMFGSIGFMMFIFAYIKSFKSLALLYNFKKPILLLGAILMLGFGFGVIKSGLFFGFMLSYWIIPTSSLYTKIDNN